MPRKSGLETPREKQIGDRVKQFRDQINWPQPPFANELGITRDRLASIEMGAPRSDTPLVTGFVLSSTSTTDGLPTAKER